ncbi:LysR substrate-binding domain-containing protein [soil metagenome]
MLDLRRLRLLHELASRGTLASVAIALNQSASSVSQQLSLLEREVGVPLLRKVGRHVQLTVQALILVRHTTAVLNRLELAEAEVSTSLAIAEGTLRVAVFQSAALALMPLTLDRLATDYPLLRVEVVQREVDLALRETWMRDFDLVIAEEYPGHGSERHEGLDRVDLIVDPLHLAVPHDTAGEVQLEAFRNRAWVMEPGGAASRHWDEQVCRIAGFEPDVRFETSDLHVLIRLIESGHAVGIVPDLLWSAADCRVRLVDLPGSPTRNIFTSARRASAKSPAILACRDSLALAAAALTRG